MVIAINIRINLCFSVENNVWPLEDILEMHNVENTITEAESYNTSIWCHYIERAIKIRLDNFHEVNNGFTWMKCFTKGFHKMAKAGIFKTMNDKTVQKWHSLFIVEDFSLF